MKVIPVFFIFILATSCSTFKVHVMSRQLKVAYETTAYENHSCNQVVFILALWCYFILRKLHFYQCIPANSLTSGTNYMSADTKLYDYIILVFTK